MRNSTIEFHFLFFLCVTNLSKNSLLDASTDEAENKFAKYQLVLKASALDVTQVKNNKNNLPVLNYLHMSLNMEILHQRVS